jgi:hypothetical protein
MTALLVFMIVVSIIVECTAIALCVTKFPESQAIHSYLPISQGVAMGTRGETAEA